MYSANTLQGLQGFTIFNIQFVRQKIKKISKDVIDVWKLLQHSSVVYLRCCSITRLQPLILLRNYNPTMPCTFGSISCRRGKGGIRTQTNVHGFAVGVR